MNIKTLLTIPLVTLLVGCQSSNPDTVRYTYIPTSTDTTQSMDKAAQDQLSEAASSVGQSLQQLSSIQEATHPGVKMGNPLNAKIIGMERKGSLNWYGEPEPVLKEIAKSVGYKLVVLGTKPAVPATISINVKDVTIASMVRNIDYQLALSKKGKINIYPSSKTIELQYSQF